MGSLANIDNADNLNLNKIVEQNILPQLTKSDEFLSDFETIILNRDLDLNQAELIKLYQAYLAKIAKGLDESISKYIAAELAEDEANAAKVFANSHPLVELVKNLDNNRTKLSYETFKLILALIDNRDLSESDLTDTDSDLLNSDLWNISDKDRQYFIKLKAFLNDSYNLNRYMNKKGESLANAVDADGTKLANYSDVLTKYATKVSDLQKIYAQFTSDKADEELKGFQTLETFIQTAIANKLSDKINKKTSQIYNKNNFIKLLSNLFLNSNFYSAVSKSKADMQALINKLNKAVRDKDWISIARNIKVPKKLTIESDFEAD